MIDIFLVSGLSKTRFDVREILIMNSFIPNRETSKEKNVGI